MKLLLFGVVVALTGCATKQPYQRFVLVPNPSGIQSSIPAGALVLDSKTGQLCYTVGGPYTSGFPAIDMCYDVLKHNPD